MHLNFSIDNAKNTAENGVLYVVATPIGNLDDITVRALKILNTVDVIAAEDTRKTKKLLSHFNISGSLLSYHEHNEKERAKELIGKLKNGLSVALVSDAGTPSVSDPGFRLVQVASEAELEVVPIPGVSAVITALCASGLPTDAFVFAGFLPRKKGRRTEHLKGLVDEKRTLVFYESPNRILSFIEDMISVFGDRKAVLAREMTKLHEEFLRGRLSQIYDTLYGKDSIKGECSLVVAGGEDPVVDKQLLEDEIRRQLKNPEVRTSALAKELSIKYSVRKNEVYETILKINKSG